MKKYPFFNNSINVALASAGVVLLTSSCINNSKSSSATDTDSVVYVKEEKMPVARAALLTADEKPPVTDTVITVDSARRSLAGFKKPVVAKLAQTVTPPVKQEVAQQTKTLKQAYSSYFPIGAAIDPKDLTNPTRAAFIARQYASITPIQALQPHVIQPKEGKFNFTDGDAVVAFAQANNMKVRGHCLVYYRHMAHWFFVDKNGKPASRELLLQRLKTHITTEMQRYKGKVYCWDVVNEAVGITQGGEKIDTLYQIIGPDYVAKCFEFAHEADPSAKLFYNDSYNGNSDRGRGIYKLVKSLVDAGVPINGMGLQFHMAKNGRTPESLQGDINKFSALGLDVQITEMDIAMYNIAETGVALRLKNVDGIYTDAMQTLQANVYDKVFQVLRRNKSKITGVTFWGFGDRPSLYLTKRDRGKNFSFLFDKDYQPKPVFFKVVDF